MFIVINERRTELFIKLMFASSDDRLHLEMFDERAFASLSTSGFFLAMSSSSAGTRF